MHSAILVSAENAQSFSLGICDSKDNHVVVFSRPQIPYFLPVRDCKTRNRQNESHSALVHFLLASCLQGQQSRRRGLPFPLPTRQSFRLRALRMFCSSSFSLLLPLNTAFGVPLLASESGLVNGGFKTTMSNSLWRKFMVWNHCRVVFSTDLPYFCPHHWVGETCLQDRSNRSSAPSA